MEGKIKYMNGEKNNICVIHETQVIYKGHAYVLCTFFQ